MSDSKLPEYILPPPTRTECMKPLNVYRLSSDRNTPTFKPFLLRVDPEDEKNPDIIMDNDRRRELRKDRRTGILIRNAGYLAVARFLATIDLFAAYAQRSHFMDGWMLEDHIALLPPYLRAMIRSVCENKSLDTLPMAPQHLNEHLAWYILDHLRTQVFPVFVQNMGDAPPPLGEDHKEEQHQLLNSVFYSPLLQLWVFGGGGSLSFENQWPSLIHYIISNPNSASFEIDFCEYNRKITGPLLNLPGEFILLHNKGGDAEEKYQEEGEPGMPVLLWQQLVEEANMRMTVGPTKYHKYDKYCLVSWIDIDSDVYEYNIELNAHMKHRREFYTTTRVGAQGVVGNPPLVTHWKKISSLQTGKE
jgi:hypothetical protein